MAAALGAMIAVAAPGAGADVKTGVDAWHRGDFKRAVDEWRPLAIAGDADAEFNLGQAYKLGRGVPLDPALARSWFLKAANQGHVQAADNYGLSLFENGQKAEAVPWLEKSAARGEPRAQLVFGTMLFNGDGVARDYPRAYALMTRAAQTRDPELAGVARSASETLAQMDGYISATERQHGIELAQRLAADETAQRVAANDRTAVPVGPRPTPRASVSAPAAREAVVAASHPSPRTSPSSHPTPSPRPAPAVPAAHSTPGGGWRVQLGAFRDAGNAHTLWSRVGGRVGGSPSYVAGGGVTRLQAGPFASRAAAQHACAAAAGGCTVIAP
jgi:hypothetical protein